MNENFGDAMSRCGKIVKKGVMTEGRPCRRALGHPGYCSPDLTGLRFGRLFVKGPGETKRHKSRCVHRMWVVISDSGKVHSFRSSALIEGHVNGFPKGKKIHGLSRTPEMGTVVSHWHYIHNPLDSRHKYYVNMPFYDKWNPSVGGSYAEGALWILKNLGPKPSAIWSLDIIKHSEGFVPGNLRWAKRKAQSDNQQHRSLGQVSEEEFAVEAKRRGYEKALSVFREEGAGTRSDPVVLQLLRKRDVFDE